MRRHEQREKPGLSRSETSRTSLWEFLLAFCFCSSRRIVFLFETFFKFSPLHSFYNFPPRWARSVMWQPTCPLDTSPRYIHDISSIDHWQTMIHSVWRFGRTTWSSRTRTTAASGCSASSTQCGRKARWESQSDGKDGQVGKSDGKTYMYGRRARPGGKWTGVRSLKGKSQMGKHNVLWETNSSQGLMQYLSFSGVEWGCQGASWRLWWEFWSQDCFCSNASLHWSFQGRETTLTSGQRPWSSTLQLFSAELWESPQMKWFSNVNLNI